MAKKQKAVQSPLEKSPRSALAWFFGLFSLILFALLISYTMTHSGETEVLGKTTSTPIEVSSQK